MSYISKKKNWKIIGENNIFFASKQFFKNNKNLFDI